jgi:hypothetical protein
MKLDECQNNDFSNDERTRTFCLTAKERAACFDIVDLAQGQTLNSIRRERQPKRDYYAID